MVRALQGTWVSRQQGLWVSGYLRTLHNAGRLDPQQEATLDRYAAHERAMLIEEASEPTLEEVLDRAGGRAGGSVPLKKAVATLRADRDRR